MSDSLATAVGLVQTLLARRFEITVLRRVLETLTVPSPTQAQLLDSALRIEAIAELAEESGHPTAAHMLFRAARNLRSAQREREEAPRRRGRRRQPISHPFPTPFHQVH